MITTKADLLHTPRWQREMAEAVTDPAELLRCLGLPLSLADGTAGTLFPMRVPRGFIRRMERKNPRDPLLRENRPAEGYRPDPVGDLASMVVPGVIHKYRGRVLLVATGVCAIHCRYCFRRHFPYADANPRRGEWEAALE